MVWIVIALLSGLLAILIRVGILSTFIKVLYFKFTFYVLLQAQVEIESQ